MEYLKNYENKNFRGIDVSLDIALYEYGLIWEEKETEYYFIYGIEHDGSEYSKFDWGYISKDIDFKLEYNWVTWKDLYSYTGMDEKEFFNMSIPQIISDLISYYGYMTIFGESYMTGFEILEN